MKEHEIFFIKDQIKYYEELIRIHEDNKVLQNSIKTKKELLEERLIKLLKENE